MRLVDAIGTEGRTITIKKGSFNFQVTYEPHKMNAGQLRRMMRDVKANIDSIEDEFERGMAEILSPNALALSMYLTDWTLEGPFEDVEDGEPIPCTLEYLELMPDEVLELITESIKKDNGSPKSRRNS